MASTPQKSWKPTKKWLTSLIGGLGTIATTFVANDLVWDDLQTGAVITLAVALIGSYFKSNDPTPTGVPV